MWGRNLSHAEFSRKSKGQAAIQDLCADARPPAVRHAAAARLWPCVLPAPAVGRKPGVSNLVQKSGGDLGPPARFPRLRIQEYCASRGARPFGPSLPCFFESAVGGNQIRSAVASADACIKRALLIHPDCTYRPLVVALQGGWLAGSQAARIWFKKALF